MLIPTRDQRRDLKSGGGSQIRSTRFGSGHAVAGWSGCDESQKQTPGTSCHAETGSSSVVAVALSDSDTGRLEIREGRRPEGGEKGWFHLHGAAGGVVLKAARYRLIKCHHFTHTFMSSRIWLRINI